MTTFEDGIDAFRIRQEAAEQKAIDDFDARQDADAAEIRSLRDQIARYEEMLDIKDGLIAALSEQLNAMTETMKKAIDTL